MTIPIALVAAAAVVVAYFVTEAWIARARVQMDRAVRLEEMRQTKLADAVADELRASIARLEEQVKSVKARDIAKQMGGRG